jgi:hypothetical protein
MTISFASDLINPKTFAVSDFSDSSSEMKLFAQKTP